MTNISCWWLIMASILPWKHNLEILEGKSTTACFPAISDNVLKTYYVFFSLIICLSEFDGDLNDSQIFGILNPITRHSTCSIKFKGITTEGKQHKFRLEQKHLNRKTAIAFTHNPRLHDRKKGLSSAFSLNFKLQGFLQNIKI